MWRTIINITEESDELHHNQIKSAIWRAVAMAKWFTFNAGGDPLKVETTMIPIMNSQDVLVSDAAIYSCTAFDSAGYHQLKVNKMSVGPPDDWKLEPIPSEPETPKESESEPVQS